MTWQQNMFWDKQYTFDEWWSYSKNDCIGFILAYWNVATNSTSHTNLSTFAVAKEENRHYFMLPLYWTCLLLLDSQYELMQVCIAKKFNTDKLHLQILQKKFTEVCLIFTRLLWKN